MTAKTAKKRTAKKKPTKKKPTKRVIAAAVKKALAVKNGVGIGAHPGFDDLQGFGRRRMQV